MLVRDVMCKDVELASPEMSLCDVAQMMRDGDYGAIPVEENDKMVGMITDRDIVTRALAEDRDPKTTKVSEVMSQKVLYCFDDQDIDDVAHNMGENQVRRLPVVNREKRLVGIIALGDIAQAQEEEAKEALRDISRHEHHEPAETLA